MGKSNSAGLSPQVSSGLQANSDALTQIAQQQNANAQKLFQEANPGFQSAENFYGTLSTGDPYAIARAISPATQQISQATTGAKQNIMNNAPSGGEKTLALEQADVNQGAQVGQAATGSFLNSFNALGISRRARDWPKHLVGRHWYFWSQCIVKRTWQSRSVGDGAVSDSATGERQHTWGISKSRWRHCGRCWSRWKPRRTLCYIGDEIGAVPCLQPDRRAALPAV